MHMGAEQSVEHRIADPEIAGEPFDLDQRLGRFHPRYRRGKR